MSAAPSVQNERAPFRPPAIFKGKGELLSIRNSVSASPHLWHPSPMVTFAEFKEQAAALTVEQRASLASFLLHSLTDPDYDVSDEEVAERFQQAKSGEVEMITFDQLTDGFSSSRDGVCDNSLSASHLAGRGLPANGSIPKLPPSGRHSEAACFGVR